MGADTADTEAVLASLGAALARLGGTPSLVLVSSQSRRRSDLWFVGREGEAGCRWVVKRPRTESEQDDLRSPLSSEGQFAALARLSEHLESSGSPLRTPAPVALLPDVKAFAMEFVVGEHVADLIRPSAILAPGRLLAGVVAAADALRTIHALEPAREVHVQLGDLYDTSRRRAEQVLAHSGIAGAPSALGRPAPRPLTGLVSAPQVVLHGDFAPENVLISGSAVYCLEPELTHRGSPDVDAVRFLTMLFDAPMFVAGARSAAVQRLRRRAARTFVSAFYGDRTASPAVSWLLAESLASRWATRHKDCARRQPPLTGARLSLLRRYFTALLQEVGDGQGPAQRAR